MTSASSQPTVEAAFRRGVVAVVFRNERWLAIRRSNQVAAPGAVCFPGGGIEAGESEAQAVVRELQEELNVRVEPIDLLWRSRTPWRVELAWWLVDLAADQVPRPNPAEVADCFWLSWEELESSSDLLESNREFLRFARTNSEFQRFRSTGPP